MRVSNLAMGTGRRSVNLRTLRTAAVLLMFVAASAAAQDAGQTLFERGEDLFLRNRPQEAVSLLEQAREADPRNGTIYMYLGVAYEQLGQRDKAVEVLREGVEVAGDKRDRMFLTMGNNLRLIEQYEAAEQSYSEAIRTNSLYAPAYRNRANLRVEMEKFEPAVEDYEIFLDLRPQSEHRPEIERMIALLRDKVEEQERRAAAEAERREREEELARREAERRRAEEEARQEALLDSVLNSLEGASEETQNLPGGSEDIQELEEDIDIVE
jgi:tetratricopeptide (TPR) repeat protein